MTKLFTAKTPLTLGTPRALGALGALGAAAVLGALSPTVTLVVAAHALLLAGGIAVVRAVEPDAQRT